MIPLLSLTNLTRAASLTLRTQLNSCTVHVSHVTLKPALRPPAWIAYDIVACQAHPALIKIGLVLAHLFHFNSLLVCICLVKVLRCTPSMVRSRFTVTIWGN